MRDQADHHHGGVDLDATGLQQRAADAAAPRTRSAVSLARMPSTIHLSATRDELGERVDGADDRLVVELVDAPLVVPAAGESAGSCSAKRARGLAAPLDVDELGHAAPTSERGQRRGPSNGPISAWSGSASCSATRRTRASRTRGSSQCSSGAMCERRRRSRKPPNAASAASTSERHRHLPGRLVRRRALERPVWWWSCDAVTVVVVAVRGVRLLPACDDRPALELAEEGARK